MRIGILTHSINAAMPILKRLDPGHEVSVLLCSASGSAVTGIAKHIGRLIVKPHGLAAIGSIFKGRVHYFATPLDDAASLKKLNDLRFDLGLHKTAIIYRQATIDAFHLGILNAHIGILPRYRGRSVLEWSLIEGSPVGGTVFFIDTGIDTGTRIVLTRQTDVSHCKSVAEAKEYLFGLDAELFPRAIEMLEDPAFEYGLNEGGQRYYVMSRLLTEAANEILAR